jgi:VanZ family protein
MRVKNVLFSYWKSILVMVGILYLSFAPPSTFESAPRFSHSHKAVHFAMFFALTAVLIYEFVKRHNKNYQTRRFLLVCILFPIALGGIIEIMQEAFFKPRSAEWLDWAADIAGVLVAWAIFHSINRRNSRSLC